MPSEISTIDLFNEISALAGRPGIERFVLKHQQVIDYWRTFDPQLVRYESFICGEVGDLESYLGVSIPNPQVGEELQRVARTTSYGEWRLWFTDEDREFIESEAEEIMDV